MRRRTLLVTASSDRRRSWEALLLDELAQVVHCAGPGTLCPLMNGSARCPLHDQVDAAIYDQEVVTPDFLLHLLATPPPIPIHFAVANGNRALHITYALSGGMVRAVVPLKGVNP